MWKGREMKTHSQINGKMYMEFFKLLILTETCIKDFLFY